MKNKIKKIIPILLCFVLVAGSCLNVNAKPVNAFALNDSNSCLFNVFYKYGTSSYTYYYHTYDISLDSGDDNVYLIGLYNFNGSDYPSVKFLLLSKSPFTFSGKFGQSSSNTEESLDKDFIPYADINGSSSSILYDNVTYYFCEKSINSASNLELLSFSIPYINVFNYINYSNEYGKLFKALYDDNLSWDDGNASVYDTQPTASIEPPQNLSIYRGYSNADKQYKFQMQWDKPADTDLNVEVMYNIHWKEGTGSALGFGTHVYKKYQHLVYDDGHSAQTNKLQYLEDDLLKDYFESQEMDVPSVYNIDEIYVRFAKEVDGVIQYSLWRKIDYLNLDEGNGFDSSEDDFQAESSTGAFDTSDNWIDQSVQNGEIVNGSDKEDAKAPGLDANGDNITNVTKPIVNPDSWDSEFSNVFDSFTNAIKSAFSFVGEFPSMLSEFFGFLPASVIGCISIGLIMVVVLRFLGR